MGAIVMPSPTGANNIQTNTTSEMRSVRGLNSKCPYCGKKFDNDGWRDIHIAKDHPSEWIGQGGAGSNTSNPQNPVYPNSPNPNYPQSGNTDLTNNIDYQKLMEENREYLAEQQKHLEERQDNAIQRTANDMRGAGLDIRGLAATATGGVSQQVQQQNLALEQGQNQQKIMLEIQRLFQEWSIAKMQNDTARMGQIMDLINNLMPQIVI